VLHPLRRRGDGSFEEIDWDTAITEVAAAWPPSGHHGGETILYYGGGGQGNHLGGFYGAATQRAFGVKFRSSAIAQEKTGEAWVNGLMLGTPVRGDFEHCEVAVFVGKNPWQSHSFPHARLTLRQHREGPRPLADRHRPTAHGDGRAGRVPPSGKARTRCVAAGGHGRRPRRRAPHRHHWLDAHASGLDDVVRRTRGGADRRLLPDQRRRRIARARRHAPHRAAASVAVFEDLGVQMNRHSTLVSYLEKLVWLLTGNLGNPGGQYAPATFVPIVRASRHELDPRTAPRSPVVGARILTGLIPCNVIPDEILTDHPSGIGP
jgi:anaerobic selenocysteine-containing dehydrogenase